MTAAYTTPNERSPGGTVPRPRSALALEDRPGDVGLVDDEREHRAIAPPPEEEVADDVDAGIRQRPGQPRHSARSIVHLGQDRLALDIGVAAVVEDRLRRLVVGRGHDH